MRFLIGLLYCLVSISGIAQISFYKTYANDSYDRGVGACQLADSSYLITGSSSSFDSPSQQAFILKIDSLGKPLWSRQYGGDETDKGTRIFAVENDGIYVFGQSNSFGDNFFDLYFLKTDLNGNLLFETQIGGTGFEDIHDAVMLPDTSFILVGETYSNPNAEQKPYVLRVSKTGAVIWSKQFSPDGPGLAEGIAMPDDTTVFFCGTAFDSNSLTQKAFITKIHSDGTEEWTKSYGVEESHGFRDLNIYDDTIRVVGYFQRAGSAVRNFHHELLRLDGSIILDHYEYHGSYYDINNIQRFGDDQYIYSMSIKDEPLIPTYSDGYDNLFYAYNRFLYYTGFAVNFSKSGQDEYHEMIRTHDGGILAVGHSSENDIVKVAVLKIDGRAVFANTSVTKSEEDILALKKNLSNDLVQYLFPNPSTGELNIQLFRGGAYDIKVFNLMNQVVFQQQVDHQQASLNLSGLKSGSYQLFVTNEKGEQIRLAIVLLN